MPKRYKEARLMHKAKLTEMAAKLGISQPTLSAWESERKSAPVEAVIKMATLYGVTTDYLLGLDDTVSVMPGQPISVQCLKLFHEKPVWSSDHGWMLVNISQIIQSIQCIPNRSRPTIKRHLQQKFVCSFKTEFVNGLQPFHSVANQHLGS